MEQNTQDKTKQRNSIKLNEKSKNKKGYMFALNTF